ncbi:MAG: YciI family protein [Streptococcaceae bacterium]|nr:YciI family protein [Streptococcaceae bacterium]MCL2681248.1 YciI family protein [Streptococcaceae bacterium]MCL2858610.1 YciI family protein [Streptococcaceae bacterium]
MKNFIILTKWKNKPTQEIVQNHIAFLDGLNQKGQYILAGPYGDGVDNEAGVFIFKAESKEDAESILNTDPFITEGCQEFEIRQLMIANPEKGYKPE